MSLTDDLAKAAKLREELAQLDASIKRESTSRPITNEDLASMADAQARADALFPALGLVGAPAPMSGETPIDYRIRLAKHLQPYSSQYREAKLREIAEAELGAFTNLEESIYADAAAEAVRPTLPAMSLRPVGKKDGSGRVITEWFGDPLVWMSQSMMPRRRVRAWNTETFDKRA
jgi:hypothetical protein